MVVSRLFRAVGVATVAATMACGVQGQYSDVSVTEYITLPKFCWYQLSDGTVTNAGAGADTQMANCGHHMNHYCFGLLDLQRSKKAKDNGERRGLLKSARNHTRYTLDGMRLDGTTGTCSITPHVQATMRAIDLEMQIYNIKK